MRERKNKRRRRLKVGNLAPGVPNALSGTIGRRGSFTTKVLYGAICFILLQPTIGVAQAEVHEMEVGGRWREYRVFLPDTADHRGALPVVFVLHGGGANAAEVEASTARIMTIGDEEHFVVVYPSAVEGHWNDGRGFEGFLSHRENVDDVGFLATIVEELGRQLPVDRNRIYATGESNGAFLCHRLALERSDLFAAIAPVAGGVPHALVPLFPPHEPVSVLIINDRDDPLLSFTGGVGPGAAFAQGTNRAAFAGFDESVRLWVTANGCVNGTVVNCWPAPRNSTVSRWITHLTWVGCPSGGTVEAYVLESGWHGWPLDPIDRDGVEDAYEIVWRFFKAHPKH